MATAGLFQVVKAQLHGPVTPLHHTADLASRYTVPPALNPKPCRHQYLLVFFTSGTQGNPPWMDTAIHRVRVLLATPFSDTEKC